MDFVVYPGGRIARLPPFLRWPMLLVRNLVHRRAPEGFVYSGDGLATHHFSPFLVDPVFSDLYDRMAVHWFDRPIDVRWRMWILTQCARHCVAVPGSFVEFGVYRAGCAFMILSTAQLQQGRPFYLFDTFHGIPHTNVTENEAHENLPGRYSDTSASYIADYLEAWSANVVLVEGDVFETIPVTEVGKIAFCHLDLNLSAPTRLALEYLYPRLVPGAMLVLDDYGWKGYEDQRAVLDAFFADKPEQLIALPTGQALVVKL